MQTSSLWTEIKMPLYPKLRHNRQADVTIIGGGMTGIIAGYLLAREGKRVCILERDKVGGVDTKYTSAHLTFVTDFFLSELAESIGEESAVRVWRSGEYAINLIESIVREENIDCGFERIPGYIVSSLSSESGDETSNFQREAAFIRRLGFEANYVASVPYFQNPGIHFPDQARFHPWRFIAALGKLIVSNGGAIFEHSPVSTFVEDPLTLTCNGNKVSSGFVIIATHDPLMGNNSLLSSAFMRTRLAPYTSYVISAEVRKGILPDALFWDTTEPYYYTRIEKGLDSDYIIFGGEDHKTGQSADINSHFLRLEKALLQLFPGVRIDHRWSGQVIETNDGLPYIGETARNQFAATGYCGNGITFGTIAAVMAHDAISGKFNPWRDLYDINRTSGLRVHESGMKLAHPTEESQLKAGSKGEMVKSSKVVPLVANN